MKTKIKLQLFKGAYFGMYASNGKVWMYRTDEDEKWVPCCGGGRDNNAPLSIQQARKLFPKGMRDLPKEFLVP